jgi:hypothetical protein
MPQIVNRKSSIVNGKQPPNPGFAGRRQMGLYYGGKMAE